MSSSILYGAIQNNAQVVIEYHVDEHVYNVLQYVKSSEEALWGGPSRSPAQNAFAWVDDGVWVQWIMIGDAQNPKLPEGTIQQISTSPFDFAPTLSANAEGVAYGEGEIYITDLRTNQTRHLIGDGAFPCFEPRWSPDGSKIAFMAMQTVTNSDGTFRSSALSQIWTISPTGAELAPFTPAGSHYDWFDWSPDGSRVLYVERPVTSSDPAVADYSGQSYIWLANADGTNAIRLDYLANFDTPRWSPNGDGIAYTSDPTAGFGTPSDLWIANLDGSNARKVTEGAIYPEW